MARLWVMNSVSQQDCKALATSRSTDRGTFRAESAEKEKGEAEEDEKGESMEAGDIRVTALKTVSDKCQRTAKLAPMNH